jgi:DTW domain-containing protein YfiP
MRSKQWLHLLVPFMFATTRCVAFVHLGRLTCSSSPSKIIRQGLHASSSTHHHDSIFLDQVETSVARVLEKYGDSDVDILDLPPPDRESLGVARSLDTRLQALTRNNDCRRCWLQQAHCVCNKCKPLEVVGDDDSSVVLPKVKRLFLLMHHKEIALHVDTAKLILAAFPETCRLVVGGIGAEYQDSMREMQEAIEGDSCLVLFPTDDAMTFNAIEQREEEERQDGWDVIVIDGTWAQARKLHSRYVQNGPTHVQLSEEAVEILEHAASGGNREGHQIRRHPIKWREVSTLEATRLFLGDMMNNSIERPWDALATYQKIGDAAARKQLGPPRESEKKS